MEQESKLYECLSFEEVVELNEVMVREVCDILKIPKTTTRMILQSLQWNSEEAISIYSNFGRSVLFSECGIPFRKKKEGELKESSCRSCASSDCKVITLECGHSLCASCWENHLYQLVPLLVPQLDNLQLSCPIANCEFYINETELEQVIDLNLYKKYHTFLIEKFICTYPYIKWCPTRYKLSQVLKSNSSLTSPLQSPL